MRSRTGGRESALARTLRRFGAGLDGQPKNAAIFSGLLLLALFFRAWQFGNPIIHPDEQFYLLAGERLLQGALLYADIWDSKPVGIFILYAAISALPGDNIVGYQLVATVAAAATALLIFRIAIRVAPPTGALLGASAYVIYLGAFGGVGGQTPVFYNFLVALAALRTLRLFEAGRASDLRLSGVGTMLILGIALQIKYSVVFEGIWLGLALLWLGWQQNRSYAHLFGNAALWIGAALFPTALVAFFFLTGEHWQDFLAGNFLTVLGRDDPLIPALARLALTIAMLTPFWVCLTYSWKRFRPNGIFGRGAEANLLRGWLIAAIVGYLIFGSYYDHYALPVLVPLSVAVAPVLRAPRPGNQLAVFLIVWGAVLAIGKGTLDRLERGGTTEIHRLAEVVDRRLNGCLYVYEGDSILYKLTDACLVTRYAFPTHLNSRKVADSMGFDVADEVGRIMELEPSVVVAAEHPRGLSNLESRAVLAASLRRGYRLAAKVSVGRKSWMVFERAKEGPGGALLNLDAPSGTTFLGVRF